MVLPDYSRQAITYDSTRGASPSVLGPLRAALAGAPGRRLADIGGGTGNYARALAGEGWDVVVVDRQPEMLAQAQGKGLACVLADARELPFADASFDAAMLVSALHHVEDPPSALREVRRVVAPGGRVAILVFTREDIASLWYFDYFPSTRAWMEATHPSRAAIVRELPGAEVRALRYGDLCDASLAALADHPEKILEERWRRQTSYFERLGASRPDELRDGLARLRVDLEAGRAPRGGGSATLLVWQAPS